MALNSITKIQLLASFRTTLAVYRGQLTGAVSHLVAGDAEAEATVAAYASSVTDAIDAVLADIDAVKITPTREDKEAYADALIAKVAGVAPEKVGR